MAGASNEEVFRAALVQIVGLAARSDAHPDVEVGRIAREALESVDDLEAEKPWVACTCGNPNLVGTHFYIDGSPCQIKEPQRTVESSVPTSKTDDPGHPYVFAECSVHGRFLVNSSCPVCGERQGVPITEADPLQAQVLDLIDAIADLGIDTVAQQYPPGSVGPVREDVRVGVLAARLRAVCSADSPASRPSGVQLGVCPNCGGQGPFGSTCLRCNVEYAYDD